MTNTTPAGSVLIIDYGSQLTQLIARRIRELNIYSEIVGYDHDFSSADLSLYGAFIFSGGPHCSVEDGAPSLPEALLKSGRKCLGICYGAQRMAFEMGGSVASSNQREYGQTTVSLLEKSPLFDHIDNHSLVLMSHSDRIEQVPKDWSVLAKTEAGVIAAITDHKNYYGVQFHPEAEHSEQGATLLKNFLFAIAGLKENWSMERYLALESDLIRRQVGTADVLLALSGGVDSLVSAVLLHKAIGKQLHCVFVDHGLLRKNEREQVEAFIRENFDFELIVADERERFLNALAGFSDPEDKRKIIGREFINVFEDIAKNRLSKVEFLAQGTIYPDIIESAGSGKGHVIKSHHNVGGLPEKLNLKIVEPLRMLFKDEVRRLGLSLNIPEKLIMRHPFPGPGLGIRVLGEIKKEYLDILQEADAIFIEELYAQNLYNKTSQAFCVFLPVKSVGVMGDNRTYDYVISLRAVETNDFMTGRFARLDLEFLGKVASRIVNEVKGVNRVTYDITNKPPATIEWE